MGHRAYAFDYVEGENNMNEEWFGINFTYPVQALADASYAMSLPQWFLPWQTRFGVRGKLRILDQYSNRFDSTRSAYERLGTFLAPTGNEWEVMTYVVFGVL